MADVRSLLRNELASRRGTSQAGSSTTRVNKKRKVETDDDLMRKKLRPAGSGAAQLPPDTMKVEPPSATAFKEDEGEEQEDVGVKPPPEESDLEAHDARETEVDGSSARAQGDQTIDEDEWAAFEREVVAPTRVPQSTIPAAAAAPTISAAPMTTEEIAAQEKEDRESMARAREAEAEGDREDAARFLEEEFDEMDQLEERVRRLKEKREELRKKKAAEEQEARTLDGTPSEEQKREEQTEAESESDEDDDDWDDWRFR